MRLNALSLILLFSMLFLYYGCGPSTVTSPDLTIPIPDYVKSVPNPATGYSNKLDNLFLESFNRGWQDFKAGNVGKAESVFEEITENKPGFFPAWAGLAYVRMLKEDYRSARRYFEKALSIRSDFLPAMLGLGVLYRVMGDPLKAYSLYGLILEKYPGQAEARIQFDLIRLRETEKYLLLARSYRQDNRIEPALENYKKALQYVLKEDFIYWEVGVFLLENKKFKEAVPYLQSAVNIKPKYPNYIKALAISLEQTGKVNQAKEYYKQVLDLNPGDETVRDDIKRINQSITRIKTGSKGISSINANERITRAQAAVYLDKNFPFFGEPDSSETGIITDIIDNKDNVAIINMVKRGIFEKYPDHTFSPKKQLTRVDLAIVIDRLIQNAVLSSELNQNTNGLYLEIDDVPLHSPSYQIIKRVVSLGIMTLDKDRKFNPGRYISGREFVSAVDKVINLAQ